MLETTFIKGLKHKPLRKENFDENSEKQIKVEKNRAGTPSELCQYKVIFPILVGLVGVGPFDSPGGI